jgi:DNA repair protein RecO (recombination protein O)
MEWHDEGIVLSARKHGETSTILEVMTRGHGRHLGLVRGGRSRKQQPVLQPGNRLSLTWRARLDEHLGTFLAEPLAFNAARLLDSACAVYGLLTLAAHLRLLPERDPHAALYETLAIVIEHLGDPPSAAELVARFELLVLEELGFGLDLARCAATGSVDDLVYVSPKTGRAVSREAGRPWQDVMLPLPAFLQRGAREAADLAGIEAAFRLTGFFLRRHVYEPRALTEPEARAGFLGAVRKSLAHPGFENGETAA